MHLHPTISYRQHDATSPFKFLQRQRDAPSPFKFLLRQRDALHPTIS